MVCDMNGGIADNLVLIWRREQDIGKLSTRNARHAQVSFLEGAPSAEDCLEGI